MQMKTLLATVAAIATVASCASAETHNVRANVIDVQPNMISVSRATPVERCEIVRVAITETRSSGQGASGGDVLGGMIVGGLIGNGVDGDRGAAIGAVIGGMITADNKRGSTYEVVTGYRNERQCYVVNEYQDVYTSDGSIITYSWNGLTGQLHTYSNYHIGDTIPVVININ